jgi:hypothetical protein
VPKRERPRAIMRLHAGFRQSPGPFPVARSWTGSACPWAWPPARPVRGRGGRRGALRPDELVLRGEPPGLRALRLAAAARGVPDRRAPRGP